MLYDRRHGCLRDVTRTLALYDVRQYVHHGSRNASRKSTGFTIDVQRRQRWHSHAMHDNRHTVNRYHNGQLATFSTVYFMHAGRQGIRIIQDSRQASQRPHKNRQQPRQWTDYMTNRSTNITTVDASLTTQRCGRQAS